MFCIIPWKADLTVRGMQDKNDESLATVATDEDRLSPGKTWESPIFQMVDIPDQHYTNAGERAPALSRISYAKDLRVLGQVLERLAIESVDLKLDSGCYVVRGQVDENKRGNVSFRVIVRNLSRLWSPREESVPRVSKGVLAGRYSQQELQELDLQARANRRDPNKLPDPYGLSQKLRGVGFYLDSRSQSSLVGISIKDRWVTIRYETLWQDLQEAKEDIEYFYNYWVKMYLRRSSRDAHAPKPIAPTYIVSDQRHSQDRF